jgi:hypothetical protein
VILSSVLYCGIALALLGALSIVRPPRALRIRSRRTALLILLGGTTVVMAAALFPSDLARDRSRSSAVSPMSGGSRVTTETRILATDDGARRRFGAYWRVIYPGSALIRIGWLDAIRRRAETPGAGGP